MVLKKRDERKRDNFEGEDAQDVSSLNWMYFHRIVDIHVGHMFYLKDALKGNVTEDQCFGGSALRSNMILLLCSLNGSENPTAWSRGENALCCWHDTRHLKETLQCLVAVRISIYFSLAHCCISLPSSLCLSLSLCLSRSVPVCLTLCLSLSLSLFPGMN